SVKMRTDSFLVIDVVDSTQLVRVDEPHFAKLMILMGRTLEQALRLEGQPFLQCTGDGFVASFETAPSALRTAVELGSTLRSHVPVQVQLSMALHWGAARLMENYDRVGSNIYAVFALERLRHEVPDLDKELAAQRTPELILITEEFRSQ